MPKWPYLIWHDNKLYAPSNTVMTEIFGDDFEIDHSAVLLLGYDMTARVVLARYADGKLFSYCVEFTFTDDNAAVHFKLAYSDRIKIAELVLQD